MKQQNAGKTRVVHTVLFAILANLFFVASISSLYPLHNRVQLHVYSLFACLLQNNFCQIEQWIMNSV